MPEVLTNAGVRVVDPVLSTVAYGYSQPDLVGAVLFPRVSVPIAGGQVLQFGKEAFYQYNLRRSPGGATKRINFGYAGAPYALLQDSVEIPIPREFQRDASVMPGIDLASRGVRLGMKVIATSLERDQANLAITAGNYDSSHKAALSGATKWSASTGKPVDDVMAAREAIRASTGAYPNVMVLSAVAFTACRNNAQVIDRYKYTSANVVTAQMLAALFELDQVVVGKAITAADDGTFSDVWGNNAVLAFAPQAPSGMEEPSYGYTYTMDGHPLVEQPYWDQNSKSWIVGTTMERQPVQTGILAGFLIQNPN